MPIRQRVDGLKQISQYLGISYNRLRLIWKFTPPGEDPLPLFTISHHSGPNAELCAWVDELDAWLDRRSQRQFEARQTK